MTTLERIRKLPFVQSLELNEDEIVPSTELESLGLDSLDFMEFLVALEDEFDIEIPQRGLPLETIQDVVDVVDRLCSERQEKAKKGELCEGQ